MNSTIDFSDILLESIAENGTFYEFDTELLTEKISKALAYCLLFVISMAGNILILSAIYRDKRLRTNVNILAFNVAICDILATLVQLPVQTVYAINSYKWAIGGKAGAILCKFGCFHVDLCFAVSVYSCLFVAIDRYYAVAHPFKGGRFSRSTLKYIIPGIWIFAGIICLPTLYNVDLAKYNEHFYCIEDWLENDQVSLPKYYYFYILILLTNGMPFFAVAAR
ncbi:substance-P receptor-like [Actinia tenebrosa]|uniref:Substance-P receptor-like n=1 Tax=Actinia tenebrosa TaxID=6105 RepID=A0A6P8IP37_ACTTE|nr:substance-P receptor-like [Actinia tenebrosa]